MKILSVDFGDARTGLACCDKTEFLASPVGVIKEWNMERVAEQVAAAAQELDCGEIIIGLPLNMNGSEGPRAQKCRDFAAMVETKIQLPVRLWDERATTVTAAEYLSENGTFGKKRKNVIDEVAATIILESYLNYRKNNKDNNK